MNINNLIINHPRRVFRFWRVGWRTERVLRKARRNPLYKLDGLSRKETKHLSFATPILSGIRTKVAEVWRRTCPARGAVMETIP